MLLLLSLNHQNGASVNGAGFTLYKYNEEIKDYKKVGEEIKGTDDKQVTK